MLLTFFCYGPSVKAIPETNFSQLIGKLNYTLNKDLNNEEILILDLDKLRFFSTLWRADLGRNVVRDEIDLKVQPVYEFLQKELERDIKYNAALTAHLAIDQKQALAVSEVKQHTDDKDICIVIPPNIDTSIYEDLTTFLFFGNSKIKSSWEPFSRQQFAINLDKQEFFLFALYHEVGHCLDRNFFRQAQTLEGEAKDRARHQAESLADVYSVLKLASLGFGNKASMISTLRTGFAFVNGPLYTQSRNSAIYYTTPSLDVAERLIAASGNSLIDLSDAGLMALALGIVAGHSMSTGELICLNTYLQKSDKSDQGFLKVSHNAYCSIETKAEQALAQLFDPTQLSSVYFFDEKGKSAQSFYDDMVKGSRDRQELLARAAAVLDKARADIFSNPFKRDTTQHMFWAVERVMGEIASAKLKFN
jgi:hypothetical protein